MKITSKATFLFLILSVFLMSCTSVIFVSDEYREENFVYRPKGKKVLVVPTDHFCFLEHDQKFVFDTGKAVVNTYLKLMEDKIKMDSLTSTLNIQRYSKRYQLILQSEDPEQVSLLKKTVSDTSVDYVAILSDVIVSSVMSARTFQNGSIYGTKSLKVEILVKSRYKIYDTKTQKLVMQAVCLGLQKVNHKYNYEEAYRTAFIESAERAVLFLSTGRMEL